jgi:hypothetical protein
MSPILGSGMSQRSEEAVKNAILVLLFSLLPSFQILPPPKTALRRCGWGRKFENLGKILKKSKRTPIFHSLLALGFKQYPEQYFDE